MTSEYAGIGEDLRGVAARLVGDVHQAMETVLNQEKSRVADIVAGIGGLLRETARQFDEQQIASVAQIAEQAADQVETAADGIRARSIDSLMEDGEDFVRRRPGWFVAGAVITGFLAARLLRRPR